ncbi:MAG: hypothetical protein KDK70_31020 [Myxococcales bacterium]|nr:hypothetical protein [Myxococcales bacterium]
MRPLRPLMLAALLCACSEPSRAPLDAQPSPRATEPAVEPPTPRRCAPPPGVSGSPTSIAAAITLLGALPPPVTVACFVESLDRPLGVFASASPFSAQPSSDVASPRIFIRSGPLTMTVIAEGLGRGLLEFGEHADDGRTIKGEVELPPPAPLSPTTPFDRVRVGDATSCSTCHDDEAPAPAGRPGLASEVLHPSPLFDVPLDRLRHAAERCDDAGSPERCELLHALFDHGEVRPATLPSGGRLCDH